MSYPPQCPPYAEPGDAYCDSADPMDWPRDRPYLMVKYNEISQMWPWRPHSTRAVLWVEEMRSQEEIMNTWHRDPKTFRPE